MKVRTALTILIAIMAVCILVVGATAVWVGQQGTSDVLAADDFVEEPADPAVSLNDELSDADLARIAGLQQNAELLPAGKEEIQMVTDDGSRLHWFSRTPSVVADGRIWPVEGPPDGDNANNVYFGGPLEGRGSWGDAGLLDEDPYLLDKGEGVSWGDSAPYEFLYFDGMTLVYMDGQGRTTVLSQTSGYTER